jgi:hypothetical protein
MGTRIWEAQKSQIKTDWNTFKSGKKTPEILAESKRRVEVDLPAQGGHNLLPVVPGGHEQQPRIKEERTL